MSSDSQPISIEEFRIAVIELPDDTLIHLKTMLLNSAAKMEETNGELQREIESTKDRISKHIDEGACSELKDDIAVYEEAVNENKVVIEKNRSKAELVSSELRKRGLMSEPKATDVSSRNDGVYL